MLESTVLHVGEYAGQQVNWFLDPLFHWVTCHTVDGKITCYTEAFSYFLAPITIVGTVVFFASYGFAKRWFRRKEKELEDLR